MSRSQIGFTFTASETGSDDLGETVLTNPPFPYALTLCYSTASIQWTSRSCVTPKSRKSFIKCTEPVNTTAKAVRMELGRERLAPLDASIHLNISSDEHLAAGAETPWTTWKALNRLCAHDGRSRVNTSKWGYSNETDTCDCGIRQTMQHILVCPMMNTVCSTQDLTSANDIAIGCARKWEGTI